MRTVSVFADKLLPISQTFIQEQASNLQNWKAVLVGLEAAKGGIGSISVPTRCLIDAGSAVIRKWKVMKFKVLRSSGRFRTDPGFVDSSLIHAHFGPNGSLMVPLARKLGIPLVTTFHGYDITVDRSKVTWRDINHKLFTYRESELKDQGDRFIAVSRFIEQRLLDRGYPKNRIVLHYIGVNVERYARYYDRERRQPKRIVFVGRLVPVKGLPELFSAFSRLAGKDKEAELVVIGSGPMENLVRREERMFSGRIKFLGALDHQKTLKEINRSAILCVPSVAAPSGASEALGIVFAEAMCLRVPVVSHIHGGIPEIVEHGKTGLLSPEKDSLRLAENLLQLLNDSELNERFGMAGFQRVSERFNILNQSRSLEVVYDSVI
jgi:glycosyltransferase involved in cell wall biosynthesis